jgi:hypothetical protein
MVRHEAAEALGGIASPEVLPHLREWMTKEDAPRVVRESCQIAIDMWEVRPTPLNFSTHMRLQLLLPAREFGRISVCKWPWNRNSRYSCCRLDIDINRRARVRDIINM